jgi:PhnB protein
MRIETYLFFEGRCEEAINYYKSALGAKVNALLRFRDAPNPDEHGPSRPQDDKVMHANVQIGDTMVLMSDGKSEGKPRFEGFAMVLNAASESEAERLFGALADGGKVQMPLSRTFFAQRFGMVIDRFGVLWMINMAAPAQ